jgi:hypothetical protein
MNEESRTVMLEHQVSTLTQATLRMEQTLGAISEALARIEERQLGISTRLAESARVQLDLEKRLTGIEVEMPGLREMRKWVVAGILGGLGMMGVSLAQMVLK